MLWSSNRAENETLQNNSISPPRGPTENEPKRCEGQQKFLKASRISGKMHNIEMRREAKASGAFIWLFIETFPACCTPTSPGNIGACVYVHKHRRKLAVKLWQPIRTDTGSFRTAGPTVSVCLQMSTSALAQPILLEISRQFSPPCTIQHLISICIYELVCARLWLL